MSTVDPTSVKRAHAIRTADNGETYCDDGCGAAPCEAYALADRLERLEQLFAGGPDTPCRTVWRDEPALLGSVIRVECVEVPMADLRAAFGEPEHKHTPSCVAPLGCPDRG